MLDLTDLPRMIMPAAFAEHLSDALSEVSPPSDATDDRVAAQVHGPGGGQWHIGVTEGVFELLEGPCAAPLVTLSVGVADWREFVAGRVRDVVKAQANLNLLDPHMFSKLQGSPERAERLRALSGDIQIVVVEKLL